MEQDYRPSKDLKDAIVIKSSTTTSAGNAGGTTLVDTVLTQADDYWNSMVVLILSGNSIGQSRKIDDFTAATDTIAVATAFNSQIASGTKYMILSQIAVAGGVAATDAGVRQVLEVSVTSAANAGAVTVGTVNTQPCVIESIIMHADTAQTAQLTSCPVTGGVSNVVTFIDAGVATQANLDAIDKQVAWTGVVRLAATKTIVMTLNGTGATAVDLTVTITYYAAVSSGTIT